jgi:mannose-6-phosphate isomerase-like protein (cupin superfamily)
MKAVLFFLAVALPSLPVFAQSPGITIWSNGVPPGGITQKANFGNHILSVSHREKDGVAELHQNKADVMIIQSGEATLVAGGEVIDPKPTAPNEIQGSGIKGGEKHSVAPGDVIEIPAGVPHQFFLAPGKQITYLLVKVIQP